MLTKIVIMVSIEFFLEETGGAKAPTEIYY